MDVVSLISMGIIYGMGLDKTSSLKPQYSKFLGSMMCDVGMWELVIGNPARNFFDLYKLV
jgi:hypothetical protein